MFGSGQELLGLCLLPLAGAALCLLVRSPRAVLNTVAAGVAALAAAILPVVIGVARHGAVIARGEWFHLDAFAAAHLAGLYLVFVPASLFARRYFLDDPHPLTPAMARRFGALWFGALAAMTLVLVSNNLGLLWVGVEASTLLTAFLICLRVSPTALEATWKYLVVCSVGVAFAFMGTLFIGAAALKLSIAPSLAMNWTHLMAVAPGLDAGLMKLAFLFLLVGYGTKAGLAPMHTWLPDAHSQAPAPVSAMFSGFMLNTALYALLRFVPLVEAATGGAAWCRSLLIGFGVGSVLLGSAFVVTQRDAKRLLAYSSVEHIGLMTLGWGIGGWGAVAAVWHMLNHALAKPLAFFAAGQLGRRRGGYELDGLAGAARDERPWGAGFVAALLALTGVAPFAIFFSEFGLLTAAIQRHHVGTAVLLLAGLATVFIAMMRPALSIGWGEVPDAKTVTPARRGWSAPVLVLVPLSILLMLGLWLPRPLLEFFKEAARVVGGAL